MDLPAAVRRRRPGPQGLGRRDRQLPRRRVRQRATTELRGETGHDASGNWALLDQIAALHWIKHNIAAFGGAPDRVTVAGWSHGAASTYAMSDSPLAAGLFHRAQMESGVQLTKDPAHGHVAGGYVTLDQAEQNGAAFLDLIGATAITGARACPRTRSPRP